MTIDLYCGDALEVLPTLDGQFDAIITDLPYGTTACKWDTVIPFAPMWAQVKRLLKPRGAFVTTASQPFTSALVMSNLDWFRYCWTWDKVNRITGFLDAKKRPLRRAEDVAVFYDGQPTYNPQMEQGEPYRAYHGKPTKVYGKHHELWTVCDGERWPQDILAIKADNRGSEGRIHPTQKPVALYEYLIRTYTNEGDTVLDFCMGSGTTGVACVNTGRSFVGIELQADYYAIAQRRIAEAQQQLAMPLAEAV